MKQFILKIIQFPLLVFVIFILFFIFKKPSIPLVFLSNDVSYNAKAFWIQKNFDKIKHSEIIVLGSSMSLNNISTKLVQDYTGRSTVNLSSWGRKISDFHELLNKIDTNKLILININFQDLQRGSIKTFFDLFNPKQNQIEFFSILTKSGLYLKQISDYNNYCRVGSKSYQNLNFDSTGAAILDNIGFKINEKRWNSGLKSVNKEEILFFIDNLKRISEKHKVIVTFSPERKIFKSENKQIAIDTLRKQIQQKAKNVSFYSMYHLNFSDTLFVDGSHFNLNGSNYFTQILLDSLKQTPKPPL
jgi:hypothetical protein